MKLSPEALEKVSQEFLKYLDQFRTLPVQILPPIPEKPVDEDWCKFAAGIMLCDISKKITIPSHDEWIGLGLLERDDGLRRMN